MFWRHNMKNMFLTMWNLKLICWDSMPTKREVRLIYRDYLHVYRQNSCNVRYMPLQCISIFIVLNCRKILSNEMISTGLWGPSNEHLFLFCFSWTSCCIVLYSFFIFSSKLLPVSQLFLIIIVKIKIIRR